MNENCKVDRKQTVYQVLFEKIEKEIREIEEKVDGTLSFGNAEVRCVEQSDTPNISPLEKDLKRVYKRLLELKQSIN